MKDQYFGDINDYRKYGLLRSIIRASTFRLLVAWMLTPDDESTDGKFITYLENPERWSGHDPVLFQTIRALLARHQTRRVNLIENTDLLQGASYFSTHVPDSASGRSSWFSSLAQQAHDSEIVFLDPDNGIEVMSNPYERRGSSKYLYWDEIRTLWTAGKSLWIYQHFIRETRLNFIQRKLEALSGTTPGSFRLLTSCAGSRWLSSIVSCDKEIE